MRFLALVILCACEASGPGPHDAGTELDGETDDVGLPDTSIDMGVADSALDAPAIEECDAPPTCDVELPTTEETDWRNTSTRLTTAMGSPRHRGHDLHLRAGEDAWALAKFSYGIADDDLEDEDVEVWLLRNCVGTWERLATIVTTESDGDHPDVLGAIDDEGWVFHRIGPLPEGRHRVHFIVRGDLSTADQFIDVLAPNDRLVMSDVDGTLTEEEAAEFVTLLSGPSPDAQPGSPELYWSFVRRGYRMFYVSARPHWLATRTHEWLAERGYPPGIVRVTQTGTGIFGSAAVEFKTGVLADLATRVDIIPEYAFGNKESDAEAFEAASVPNRMLYQMDEGDLFGGRAFDDYSALSDEVEALPLLCVP